MDIKNPELAAHVRLILQMDANWLEPAVKPILALMDAFGSPCLRMTTHEPLPTNRTWRPTSPAYKELVDLLTAPEHRGAIRLWYAQFDGRELNGTATHICEVLSDITGEDLRRAQAPDRATHQAT